MNPARKRFISALTRRPPDTFGPIAMDMHRESGSESRARVPPRYPALNKPPRSGWRKKRRAAISRHFNPSGCQLAVHEKEAPAGHDVLWSVLRGATQESPAVFIIAIMTRVFRGCKRKMKKSELKETHFAFISKSEPKKYFCEWEEACGFDENSLKTVPKLVRQKTKARPPAENEISKRARRSKFAR